MSGHPTLRVRGKGLTPLRHRHPWVFAGSLEEPDEAIPDGAVVDLVDAKGSFLGRGFWNGRSKLRVRALAWSSHEDLADPAWLRRRLAECLAVRTGPLDLPSYTEAYRVVHSDGDGLGGLIVDRYGPVAVVGLGSLGWELRAEELAAAVRETLGVHEVSLRRNDVTRAREGLPVEKATAHAPEDDVVFREGRLRFGADPRGGQKTGHYLDQRENRLRAAAFAKGRSVLDAYAYTGGFAVACAAAGASNVLAIDSSEPALRRARRHAAMNGVDDRVAFECADLRRRLPELASEGRRFGLVILDPPKLATSRLKLEAGLGAYVELNTQGLRLLEPGGVLVSCTCSGLVSEAAFERALNAAGLRAGRRLRVLERHGAPADHPVNPACPESRYLTCLVVLAE